MNLSMKKVLRNKYVVVASMLAIIVVISLVVRAVSNADETASVKYRAHVAYNGWLDWKSDGATAGTTGESKRMEAIKLKLDSDVAGDIVYSTFVRDSGWQVETRNSGVSGIEGQSKQIEAIKIRLEGEIAKLYDVIYRVHIKNGGWQEWVSNGAVAGSDTFGLRVEAIEVKLASKEVVSDTGVSFDEVINEQLQQDAQVEVQQPQEPVVEEQPQVQEPVVEEQPQVQEPVVQEPVRSDSPFHKYTDLTETQLKGLARLCQQEQGTAKGAAAEASLMANHMDLRHCNARKYEINGEGLYNYVRYGKWFAHAAKWMDKQDPRPEVLEAVRKVLVEGKRTLPGYVNEHDCFSDISSAGGINIKDRSAYVPHSTYIKNKYGGNYYFYCFPTDTSDPFGYTSKTRREEIGDFCYKFEDI